MTSKVCLDFVLCCQSSENVPHPNVQILLAFISSPFVGMYFIVKVLLCHQRLAGTFMDMDN